MIHMNQYSRLLQFIDNFIPNFKMNSFNQRFLLQKLIYLADRLNYDFGETYNYRLYLRGPYATDLTQSGFYVARLLEDYPQIKREEYYEKLSTDDKKIIKNLKNIVDQFGYDPDNIKDKTLGELELLATLDFVLKRRFRHLSGEEKLTNVQKFLLKRKPRFAKKIKNDKLIQDYLGILKEQFNLQDDYTYN